MTDRFGYDPDEGLMFDRTKPYAIEEGDDQRFEEITTTEMLVLASGMDRDLKAALLKLNSARTYCEAVIARYDETDAFRIGAAAAAANVLNELNGTVTHE